MRYINLKYFDGEAAISESGAPEAGQGAESIEQPTDQDSAGNSGITDIDGDDYAAFDRKSPLLRPGRYEDKEDEKDDDKQDAGELQGNAGTAGEGTDAGQQIDPAPYKTLKYHEQEIPVQTEDDLMRLASQGLDYTRKTQRLASYRALIDKLEADPSLMAHVAGLINGETEPQVKKTRERPKPQRGGEQEPAPREDETWDEFVARRDAWKAEHEGTDKSQSAQKETSQDAADGQDFMDRFNAAMKMREDQQTAVRLAQMTLRDPRHLDVLNVINSEVPKSMQDAMNRDPVAYQMVYDQIRQNLTGEMYFAGMGRKQTQQTEAARQTGAPPPQQNGQVTLKSSSKPAPVVESGRGQRKPDGGKSGTSETDFWGMSDADFNNLMERTMSSR